MNHIRFAEKRDLPQVKKLFDENFGTDFYTSDYLAGVLSDPNSYLFAGVNDSDLPVALLYMFTASFADARKLLKIPETESSIRAAEDELIMVYKSTCTDSGYRGQGYLNDMMSAAENEVRRLGSRFIILEAIQIPSGLVPAAHSVERYHFRPVCRISQPWSDIDSFCPYCESRFCKCDAVLYIKDVEQNYEY